MTIAPYPLVLQPKLFDKVWGGDRLARFGKAVQPGASVGESWEVADMDATSASGAGGGEARSVIAEGPLAGKTLRDAVTLWGKALLGPAMAASGKTINQGFPLLVKFLDAKENLSVQVHPSPQYAKFHPGANLKTECWYILDAAPGAVIYKGVKPGVTKQSFAEHIRDGTVVNDMIAEKAVAGECHNLPSGTVHALGAGVLVAEVQTPSDTTYRVFDWGRAGRELHVDQALECIDWGRAPAATRLATAAPSARLVTTEYFTLDEIRPIPGSETRAGTDNRAVVLIPLAGTAQLASANDDFPPMQLVVGRSVVVPSALVKDAAILAGKGTQILRAGVGGE